MYNETNTYREREKKRDKSATVSYTLPKFNIALEKLHLPNRKGSSSNHHFSGAMLNFGGVSSLGFRMQYHKQARQPYLDSHEVMRWCDGLRWYILPLNEDFH